LNNLFIKSKYLKIIFVFFIFYIFNISQAFSQTPDATKNKDKASPIHIKSDIMESQTTSGDTVFSGNVTVNYNDIVINADKLEVIYLKADNSKNEKKDKTEKTDEKDKKDPKKNIDRLIATGNVKITQNKKIITGAKAVYEKGPEKITITGDAQAWDDKNRIKGDTIIYYVKEEKSVVQGKGKEKVEAIVYPSE
jgi:lipopolysaccharide export system protein LptA